MVELNQDFQDALPLLPGVVRGFDGLIRIKGGRTNQANTLVNSASVTDPFTGQAALSLPAVAVQSVQVLSNPFAAEYGRFASGVVDVNTRSGTDEWKFLFEDPVPRFRWINGNIHGIESASPHFTFAGPIKKGELYIFQSIGYGYDTVQCVLDSRSQQRSHRGEDQLVHSTRLEPSGQPAFFGGAGARSAEHRIRQHQYVQSAARHRRLSPARLLRLRNAPLDSGERRIRAVAIFVKSTWIRGSIPPTRSPAR